MFNGGGLHGFWSRDVASESGNRICDDGRSPGTLPGTMRDMGPPQANLLVPKSKIWFGTGYLSGYSADQSCSSLDATNE